MEDWTFRSSALTNLEDDVKESLEWLQSNNYRYGRFEEAEYRGFVLANEENLEALRNSEHIALMDSTHKTNKLVSDFFGSWLPARNGNEQVDLSGF